MLKSSIIYTKFDEYKIKLSLIYVSVGINDKLISFMLATQINNYILLRQIVRNNSWTQQFVLCVKRYLLKWHVDLYFEQHIFHLFEAFAYSSPARKFLLFYIPSIFYLPCVKLISYWMRRTLKISVLLLVYQTDWEATSK